MLEIGAIVWGVQDLNRAIKFWTEALNYKLKREPDVDRLIQLGAIRVDWNYDTEANYVVLSDPDGNTFCIVQI